MNSEHDRFRLEQALDALQSRIHSLSLERDGLKAEALNYQWLRRHHAVAITELVAPGGNPKHLDFYIATKRTQP